MNKSDRLAKVHEDALKGFDIAYQASQEVREAALAARKFCDEPGAQWDDWLGKQFENRPRMEVNKIARSVDRIYNEYRNNRITVDFRPKTENADDDTADLLDDMYRADEQDSGAQEAYDNAFQEGVKGGFGGWRLNTDYEDHEDEDNERQCIQIIPINDADACLFFDADAMRYDKADATRAWLIKGMTRGAYEEKFPDNEATSFDRTIAASFDWITKDVVYVAEYYVRETYSEKLYTYKGLTGDEVRLREDELDEAKRAELDATGYKLDRTRKIERKRVRKYIINGAEVIEDLGYIAGEHIPLIPYYGNRSIINGVERAWGQVQRGKDAQQLYNMQISVIAETAALGSVTKPILFPEQVAGHEHTWAYDNIARNPYLLINMVRDAADNPVPQGPVAYTQPPQLGPAVSALLEISNRDIADVTGNQDQAQSVVSNVSAQAVEMVQNRLDMGVFGYMDNMASSMKRCATVWLSIRREIETERRKVRTVKQDGSQGSDEIMVPTVNEDGASVLKNDISSGKYDVAVDVGPSFTTRRDATIKGIIELMSKTPDPGQQALLSQVALMNMDGEGLGDLRKYARKQLVNQGVVSPTKEEEQEMAQAQQNKQPDPQAAFLLASAKEAEGKAVKAAADSELVKAKTAETLAGIDQAQFDRMMQLVQALHDQSQAAAANAQAPVSPDQQQTVAQSTQQ